MKTKRLLLAWLLACLLPLPTLADGWGGPGWVIYNYAPGSGVASVGRSPFASGDIEILSTILIEESEYVVTKIDDNAFLNNTRLNSVSIPSSVTTIGSKAFQGCANLSVVTLQNGLKTIGVEAFYSCTSLGSITIPNSVTAISELAFSGCTSLLNVISFIKEPFEIDSNIFLEETYSNGTLYVPWSTLSNYKIASGWNKFQNIQEMDMSAEGYFMISSVEKWKAFAAKVEEEPNLKAQMTADIDLGNDQTMIGSSVPFKGVFDGQGHTLTVNIHNDESAVAPFRYVDGATIENLHVTGKIETTRHAVGGIAGLVLGTETPTIIRNCWSSSLMASQGNGPYDGTIGGIVSENHGVLIIEDCLFDGRFADSNTFFNGGIIANTFHDLTIRNTLNVGSYPSQSTSGTFYRTDSQSGTVNLENVYYKNVCGTPQGTQVTDEQLADGTVAALLQNGRSESIWIQGESTPILSSFGTTIGPDKDVDAPVLLDSAPQNEATDVPVSGNIVLTFDEPIKVSEQFVVSFNGKELVPIVKDSTIIFEYSGLEYNKSYTFVLPANSVMDLAGNYHSEDISLSFTTSEHPTNAILPFGQFSQEPWTAKSMQNPPEEWYMPDFDDSEWELITGPINRAFGSNGLPYWNTAFPVAGKYWLRRHFIMDEIEDDSKYLLYVTHDDDCVVWINGTEVLNETFYHVYGKKPWYSTVIIDGNLLKKGNNVIAVYIHDSHGAAWIDFGLYSDADISTPNGFITTDKQQYAPGETVLISGTATGNFAKTELEVYVVSDGVKQVINTTADAQGAFTAEWVPLSGQLGRFTIGVSYQGIDITPNPVQIDVIGMRHTSNSYITCETVVGVPFTGELEVENPGQTELHFSSVEILTKPENCEVSIDSHEVIAAGGKAVIAYTLEGSAPSAGNDWELVQLRLNTVEGATLDVTLYYFCRSSKGVLAADKDKISTTMTMDAQRDYPITIANRGKGATGIIHLSLPNVTWMTAATPVEMPSLAAGEEATIMLRLQPTDGIPLNVPQTGTIGINCDNGDGLAISYSIEAVSQQTGTLTIDAVDEYTEFTAEKPHVAGATVTVMHPTTAEVIAQGMTATDGHFSCELPEGYYAVSVTAPKHYSYTATLLVDPGRELLHEAFISFQAISYSYTMEETEIEDQYNIVTTVTYETNVHKPVLCITLPNGSPGPNEVFPIVVTNQGLISAVHVDMHPYITPSGFTFELLNPEPVDELKAQESYTFYGVIKCDEDIWASSCIKAWVVVDGFFIYRDGIKPVDTQIAYIYNCNQQGQTPVVDYTITWPVATPPVPPIGGSTVSGGSSGGGDITPWTTTESFPVKTTLQIEQVMVMKRPAYRGTLFMRNSHDTTAITDVRLDMVIKDEDGNTDTSEQFQVAVESLSQFQGELTLTDGWTLGAQQAGEAKILFIPTKLAAPTEPKDYTFSGMVTCTDPFTGLQLQLPLYPHTFTVRPLPELELTYLMQRDVYGDDPLTSDITEPSVPAEFALIINNKGNGQAKDVRMLTEQPKIVENESGLLLNMGIVKSQVNGNPAQLVLSPTITNNFGTIPAHSQTYAQWWLKSSLLGHFVSYEVEAAHVTSYGNANLSLIDTVTIHEMTHGFTPMANGQSLMTNVKRGWLVNDIVDADDMPDVVYFSNATQQPLYIAKGNTKRISDSQFMLTVAVGQSGWNYGSVDDPTGGSLVLAKVTRSSDGAEIPLDNVWQTNRTLRDGREWLYENRLLFVGQISEDGESYLLTFKTPEEVGIKDIVGISDGLHVRLSPIPMTDWLFANGNFGIMKQVTVIDMRGIKRLQKSNVLPGQGLYIGGLSAGLYYVIVDTDKGVFRTKVLKK